jgi:eukaryotic-like serine/threonine-protein kinase
MRHSEVSFGLPRKTMRSGEIGPYEILEQLGEGGMGEVYKARDTRLHRLVALKFMLGSSAIEARARRRFLEEARTASRLDHPNIGTVYDVGDTPDGAIYIAMAYYPGATIGNLLGRGFMDVGRALDIARQVGEGLDCAHRHQIIHRDIKPRNIIVTPDGLAKILDFGLATLSSEIATTTSRNEFAGTPGYMSPEQLKGGMVDARSDIWAWGVLMYEMLTGANPFLGPDMQATFFRILSETPALVNERREEVPSHVAETVRKALSVNPDGRFDTMRAALDCLSGRVAVATGDGTASAASSVATPPATFAEAETTRAKTAPRVEVLAVLPFRCPEEDESSAAFSEGLTEEILNLIARGRKVRVLGHASTFRFPGRSGTDAASAGRELGATIVLTGSVQRSGQAVRVTAQIIEVATGYIRWSNRYGGDMSDIFAIQDRIARAIAETTEAASVTSIQGAVPQHIPPREAHERYMLGRYHLNRLNRAGPSGVQLAMASFQKAVEIDPEYAAAWCGLADLYLVLAFFRFIPFSEGCDKAQAAVRRALDLDDSLAEAHTSMGAAMIAYDWSLTALAEREFKRATDLNPSYPLAYFWYAANILAPAGRLAEAEEAITTAVSLDPLSPVVHAGACGVFGATGNLEKAIAEGRQALEIEPDFIEAHMYLSKAYYLGGDYQKSIEILEDARSRVESRPWIVSGLGSAYAKLGREAEAKEMLAKMEEFQGRVWVPPSTMAYLHLALGDNDAAVACVEQGYKEKDFNIRLLELDSRYQPILDRPEILRIRNRLKAGSAITGSERNRTHTTP